MWLCLFACMRFEATFKNAQWRKVIQMQPMWLCLVSGRPFEETFENAQWRKVKQMQPMWLCILTGRPFEETFENAQWRKVKQMQPMWLCCHWRRQIEETFESAQWIKVKQIKHCVIVSNKSVFPQGTATMLSPEICSNQAFHRGNSLIVKILCVLCSWPGKSRQSTNVIGVLQ